MRLDTFRTDLVCPVTVKAINIYSLFFSWCQRHECPSGNSSSVDTRWRGRGRHGRLSFLGIPRHQPYSLLPEVALIAAAFSKQHTLHPRLHFRGTQGSVFVCGRPPPASYALLEAAQQTIFRPIADHPRDYPRGRCPHVPLTRLLHRESASTTKMSKFQIYSARGNPACKELRTFRTRRRAFGLGLQHQR